ncbi:hypothetical protein MUO79_03895 [Candidatus Bathyarchaeota archaeon]|jgi:hypothetical protein|nr:hypothetical protein [Candidatus Bathyarchaeota archaeon]
MYEIKLNCRLKGEVAEKFAEIKKHKGLTNSTEAIRLVITEYYGQMVKLDEVPAAC